MDCRCSLWEFEVFETAYKSSIYRLSMSILNYR